MVGGENLIFDLSVGTFPIQILELFPNASVVCLPFFMENNLTFAASVKATGKLSYPTLPDRKMPWMAVDDAGKCAASTIFFQFSNLIEVWSRCQNLILFWRCVCTSQTLIQSLLPLVFLFETMWFYHY